VTAEPPPQPLRCERVNARALEACGRHAFGPIRFEREAANRARYRCVHRGGEVDGKAARWYRFGLLHGRHRAHK